MRSRLDLRIAGKGSEAKLDLRIAGKGSEAKLDLRITGRKMRCKKEEFVRDAVFHIYNHSVAEIDLFYDRHDYFYFLQKLTDNFSSDEIAVYAYCLMPNHFHFCIKQKSDRPIYDIFNRFLISYTLHFNAKYKRKGKVFANKLQHKKINNDKYLLDICPYIHRNPVKAGLVNLPCEWEFSNYHEWLGSRNSKLFDNEVLVNYFEDPMNYKKYVENFDEIEIKEYLYSKT
ncbi:MAG: hypothetical protein DRH79_00960 [Candidatus Cloacimonadota bacterium]|nr:MAG: hypothetical protein DRH79_00960 [Candidatus Cloacimonadota bacterium]